MTVHHVFPYDPGHLGLTLEQLPGIVRSLSDLGVRLGCVGSPGRPTDAQRAAAAFEGLPVELAGELRPADLAERMRGWTAPVLPSYSEGLPLVALEALCSGIPSSRSRACFPAPTPPSARLLVGRFKRLTPT